MTKTIDNVSNFLMKQTVWMHLTSALVLAYVYMQMTHSLGMKFFIGWTIGQLILGLPILFFIVYRDNVSIKKGTKYWIYWSALFLLYPLGLFLLNWDINTLPGLDYLFKVDIKGEWEFSICSLTWLGIEIVLTLSEMRLSKTKSSSKVINFNVFKTFAIIVLLFSFILILLNNYLSIQTQNMPSFEAAAYTIGAVFQLFIIYLSYYIYFYIHQHILFTKLLIKKGILRYIIGIALVLMVIVPVHNYVISLFPVVEQLKLHTMGLNTIVFDDFNYGTAILVLLFSFPIIATIEWYKNANALNVIEKEKSKIELSLLRQQINPHFFFNTLNNLYAMSLTNDKETPETILQLSELMRYVIYKGKEEKVTLRDEVKYLKDYIDLHMIRAFKKVDYKFDVNINSTEVEIPPLLFIILIENAIKHGIEPSEHSCKLHIELSETDKVINFTCFNTKEDNTTESAQGIGLNNLKNRLELLYPDKHEMIIKETNHYYLVKLNIQL